MINPITWAVSKYRDWKFYRDFDRAPIKRLGEIFVKEVQGNLYAVTLEIVPAKKSHD
jgi:hypothetical protein